MFPQKQYICHLKLFVDNVMFTFQKKAELLSKDTVFLNMSWKIRGEHVMFTNWNSLPIQGSLMEGETSRECPPPSKLLLTEKYDADQELQQFIPDLKKHNNQYWSTAIAFREAILDPQKKLSQLMIEAQAETAFKITFEGDNILKIPFSIDEAGPTVAVVKRLEDSMYEGQIACIVMAEFLANRKL